MRFSKNFNKKNFFKQREILSPRAALFFVIEESILLFLIIYQISIYLGIKITQSNFFLFQNQFRTQNYIWLLGSVFFLIIGYLTIVLRDKNVWLIHQNFSRLLFGTIKLKIELTTLPIFIFVLAELALAILIAISIYLYLNPDIDLIPAPYNYITFAFLLMIALLLFSHSKEFRNTVYGPTPLQKKFKLNKPRIKRKTNPKTGSISFKEKKKKKKK